jgi:hypothetical protein
MRLVVCRLDWTETGTLTSFIGSGIGLMPGFEFRSIPSIQPRSQATRVRETFPHFEKRLPQE